VVSAERTLAAEFPVEALARSVLNQIGAGERTFTAIARAAGGLHSASAARALEILTYKRVVSRDLPLSTRPSRDARYRVADPYLRFWLRFVGPHLAEVERGRGDRVVARVREGWPAWRGRAIEPVIRDAVARLLPMKGVDGPVVGGYWTRTNSVEVDLIGADRPQAKAITFAGSIKWLEARPFETPDLNSLVRAAAQVPGAGPRTPLVAVSRSGTTARGAALRLGPDDLILSRRPGRVERDQQPGEAAGDPGRPSGHRWGGWTMRPTADRLAHTGHRSCARRSAYRPVGPGEGPICGGMLHFPHGGELGGLAAFWHQSHSS
jgi:hypothetical protein